MIRTFAVTLVLNGYIVEIGCQRLVFASTEALEQSIARYLQDPNETEEWFKKNSLNSKHFQSGPNVTPPNPIPVPSAIRGDQCGQEDSRPGTGARY